MFFNFLNTTPAKLVRTAQAFEFLNYHGDALAK